MKIVVRVVNRWCRWFIRNLLFFIFLGVWVLLMLFINFNVQFAKTAQQTKDAADATKTIVSKQDDTLNAIQLLAQDNKLTSKQLGDTIICMLQVPIAQRTTDVEENCRKQATVAISNQTSPNNPPQATQTPQNSSNTKSSATTQPEPKPDSTPPQPPKSQGQMVIDFLTAIPDSVRKLL